MGKVYQPNLTSNAWIHTVFVFITLLNGLQKCASIYDYVIDSSTGHISFYCISNKKRVQVTSAISYI